MQFHVSFNKFTDIGSGVKKYRVPKIERPSAYRTLCKMVCYAPVPFVCQGHALHVCLRKEDSQLWGIANVLTPGPKLCVVSFVSGTYSFKDGSDFDTLSHVEIFM